MQPRPKNAKKGQMSTLEPDPKEKGNEVSLYHNPFRCTLNTYTNLTVGLNLKVTKNWRPKYWIYRRILRNNGKYIGQIWPIALREEKGCRAPFWT